MGAAPLSMVATLSTGEADPSSGNASKQNSDLIVSRASRNSKVCMKSTGLLRSAASRVFNGG